MAILKPTFSITLGRFRSQTSNPVGGMISITIDRQMDVPVDSLRIHLMARSGVELGDVATIELGHDEQNEQVFTGKIVELRPTISGVTLHALGEVNALVNLRLAKVYENQTLGQIAQDLIQQAGLSAGEVETGGTLPFYAIDSRLNAFAHLKGLADRFGYELYADRNGNVMFHPLGDAANLGGLGGLGGLGAAAIGQLGSGGDAYAFGQHLVQATASQQVPPWGKLTVGGESPMSRQGDTKVHWLTTQDTDHQGSAGSGNPEVLLLDPIARTKDLGDRIAAGRIARQNRNNHRIQIRILGRSTIDLGDQITTQELPDGLINGSGYVRSLRHRFSHTQGFLTDVGIVLGRGTSS